MENRTGVLFRTDGAGIVGGYRADTDRPKQSVPLFICFPDSGGHVQPDRHGADEVVEFFYRIRASSPA